MEHKGQIAAKEPCAGMGIEWPQNCQQMASSQVAQVTLLFLHLGRGKVLSQPQPITTYASLIPSRFISQVVAKGQRGS